MRQHPHTTNQNFLFCLFFDLSFFFTFFHTPSHFSVPPTVISNPPLSQTVNLFSFSFCPFPALHTTTTPFSSSPMLRLHNGRVRFFSFLCSSCFFEKEKKMHARIGPFFFSSLRTHHSEVCCSFPHSPLLALLLLCSNPRLVPPFTNFINTHKKIFFYRMRGEVV